jgi:hypothetical protein
VKNITQLLEYTKQLKAEGFEGKEAREICEASLQALERRQHRKLQQEQLLDAVLRAGCKPDKTIADQYMQQLTACIVEMQQRYNQQHPGSCNLLVGTPLQASLANAQQMLGKYRSGWGGPRMLQRSC